MNPTPHISQTCSHSKVEGCHHQKKSKFAVFINVIEKISAFALGVFAAYVSWILFVPFFFVGVCIGVYSYIQDKSSHGHGHLASSCAHGLLEQLTGVKLPPVVSLAANIAVTVCHIDHHATVFFPIIGVSLGAWIGKTAAHYGHLAYKKFSRPHVRKDFSLNPALFKINYPGFSV